MELHTRNKTENLTGTIMAKFTRYDPRNKKDGRHKTNSLKRDIRIRYVEEDTTFKILPSDIREIHLEEDHEESAEVS